MSVKQSHYEALLAQYSEFSAAIALLKKYRLYMEMIPSIRRANESLISIPLPIARLREGVSYAGGGGTSISPGQAVCLPCDLVILMCDPEWKVKIGVEILVFIHRPGEDFSDLLGRWRQCQVWLDKTYEWVMPYRYRHIFSAEAEAVHPLFVLFDESSDRIQRGLMAAGLPFVVESFESAIEELEDGEFLGSPELGNMGEESYEL
ncbi:hypothetical protein [Microcoleus sp. bin38.metabat.b11b12b14.051]|uniref:hypothetical protein n=1 Tax=Microcoleus sp. bin38.metabat.b11b12b14.051 TaxID=2742709 RepID=UPI0025CCE399|nr:hypothetical protein [Microcoleus sp. bin38.metabat.b11b12b14.051]